LVAAGWLRPELDRLDGQRDEGPARDDADDHVGGEDGDDDPEDHTDDGERGDRPSIGRPV
jgi:hypothetical protein